MKTNVKSNVNGRKYTHNLTHRVSTTSGFGFVQPLMCREVSPQTTLKMRVGQSVYLNPMVKPTFGACSVKTYESFVPIADIWHPFESFLSGQTYRGANAHYVPTSVPKIPQIVLSQILKSFSNVVLFGITNPVIDERSVEGTFVVDGSVIFAKIRQAIYTKWNSILSVNFWTDSILQSRWLRNNNITVSQADWLEVIEIEGTKYLLGGVYHGIAKDLRKIFIGCGYQINNSVVDVSLLPLFAYYKAYFDLFFPARDKTWKDTAAFGFMEFVEQGNKPGLLNWGVFGSDSWTLFNSFILDELGNCFYTQNPDYVSAHITGTQLDIAVNNESVDYVDPYGQSKSMTGTTSHQASIDTTYSQNIGFPALNILRKLTQRINSHTALGGRIKEFMRSVFDSDYRDEKESNYIGSQITPISIDEVMNQAETSEGYLGEYAAKGRATNPGSVNTFTSHDFGFVIIMSCVVPDSRYCQAVDPLLNHITRRSFFDPDFDSVTLLPTPKYNIYGTEDLFTDTSQAYTRLNGGFGNIPNYMEYKQAYDVINGEMSQRGKRASYLPFTLDKLLPYTNQRTVSSTVQKIENLPDNLLVNGSVWRYVGKDQWLGNFNRIFVNSGNSDDWIAKDALDQKQRPNVPDDNFIIHNYLDIVATAPWLPTADSFDTGSLEGNDMKVEKA